MGMVSIEAYETAHSGGNMAMTMKALRSDQKETTSSLMCRDEFSEHRQKICPALNQPSRNSQGLESVHFAQENQQ